MEDKTILQEKNLLNGIFGFDSVDIQWKNALTFHMDTSYVKVKTSPLAGYHGCRLNVGRHSFQVD